MPGRQQHELVRIDHRVAGRVARVAVPGALRIEGPALLFALDDLGRQLFPGDIGRVLRELRAANGHDVGNERIEEPLFLGAHGRYSRSDGRTRAVSCAPRCRARCSGPTTFLRPCRREPSRSRPARQTTDRTARSSSTSGTTSLKRLCSMKRRCPRMCSSRLWICEACEKPAPCLCTDCVENRPGHFRLEILQAHRAVIGEQRMERVVADPGLVPQHVVAEVADLLHDLADVVDRAVVGRELDARQAKRPLRLASLAILDQRIARGSARADISRPTRPSRPRRSCRTHCAPSAGRSESRPP